MTPMSWEDPVIVVRLPKRKMSRVQRLFDSVCLFAMALGLGVIGYTKDDPTAALTEMVAAVVLFLAVLFWMASREL